MQVWVRKDIVPRNVVDVTSARVTGLGEEGTLYLTILVPGKIVVVTGARDIGLGEKRPEGGGGGYSGGWVAGSARVQSIS